MKTWLSQYWRKLLIAGAALLFVLSILFYIRGIFLGVAYIDRTGLGAEGKGDLSGAVHLVTSPLTGLDITETTARLPVISSMISNSYDARPQSGLDKAGVVFEAIAEGGITRYLALFQDEQPEMLGPVRSLRPYFIDFARGFDAYVAHAGGSPRALREAKTKLKDHDLDQFRYGTQAFERVDFRFAPHNLYTSFSGLLSLTSSGQSEFTSLLRKEPEPAAKPNATSITINYSSSTYNTRWEYDEAANNYLRFLDNEPHKDKETGTQLAFDVVVVIKTPYSIYTENGTSYNDVKTTGTGEALIFQDGKATKATWNKKSSAAQYTFTDKNKTQLALNAGRVWFAVQPTSQETRYE